MTELERFLNGDLRALAHLVSHVENRRPEFRKLLAELYPRAGRTVRIGITGPPGAGKSTLVNSFARSLLGEGKSVGVIAVDPTSPFTGGALLGDRVRMDEFESDQKFFFRSMATRGASGGLAQAAGNVALLYDAFGFDFTIIETVGVGQVELDIVDACDTVVVMVVPESGDAVQTMKAGLMEIADIFCVNKADRPGAERINSELKQMLKLRKSRNSDWKVPVVSTEATTGKGCDILAQAIAEHLQMARKSSEFKGRRRRQIRKKLDAIMLSRVSALIEERLPEATDLDDVVTEIYAGKTDPYTAADKLLNRSISVLENNNP
ncbi:MAG: methylmalonyl Co-A mutase-associated GTPase MeaB [candidate division Zixibacteria bacterium]